MNLRKKKDLIVRTLGVGRDRVVLNIARLSEIKEAITKQDIRDLVADGAISIKDIKGRAAVVRRKRIRHAGSVKKKIVNTKRVYMNRIRKFRSYLKFLRGQGKITEEKHTKLRQELKANIHKTKQHLKDRITQLQ